MQEDLNLYRMKARIIKECWFDKKRFPKIKDICEATGLTERTLHRWVHDLDLPKRTGKSLEHYFIDQYKKRSNMKYLVILAIIAIFMSSCRTTGYGCKGNHSWNDVVNKANRLY